MPNQRTWAALPAAALMTMTLLAAGCAAASTSGATTAASGSGATTAGPASGSGSGSAPGAAGSPGLVPTITESGSPVPGEVACASWPTGVKTGPLTNSFVPVAVLRCLTGTKMVPGKGVSVTATLERATSDLTPLVVALRHPSTHRRGGQMCPMIAMLPPQIVLIAKDGSMLIPTFPVQGCGFIQQPVLAALKAMPWQALSVRVFPPQPGAGATGTSPGGQSS
jgi:hypothetical protein